MDKKSDISIVVSAFPLAGMHLFIFVVPVIYLKVLCRPCSVLFLSPHPYILLHVSVTTASYYYCALSCSSQILFNLRIYVTGIIWTMCEYYQCLPSTAEVIRVPVKYLCC